MENGNGHNAFEALVGVGSVTLNSLSHLTLALPFMVINQRRAAWPPADM